MQKGERASSRIRQRRDHYHSDRRKFDSPDQSSHASA
jgi:hypothetical protein